MSDPAMCARRTYPLDVLTIPSRPAAGGPLTYDDLQSLPDDGRRYELLDGALLVTPSPSRLHQRGSTRLAALLAQACPAGLEVLAAPLDWIIAPTTVVEPDLVVVRRDLRTVRIEEPPLLAVEVLSPTTRRRDRGDKRSVYEDAGLCHYWVVDPDPPSIEVYRLRAGRLRPCASARGSEPLGLRAPFAVRLVASELFED